MNLPAQQLEWTFTKEEWEEFMLSLRPFVEKYRG